MTLAWKKLSDKRITINRYRSLRKKRFRLPTGVVGDFYTNNTPDIVSALVVTTDKRVVLVKQFRPGIERMLLEVPGGAIESGEKPRSAVAREVLEETGYRGRVQPLGKGHSDAWSEGWWYHHLVTDAIFVQPPKHDRFELIEVVVVPMKKFLQMIQQGAVVDSRTVYRGLLKLGILKVKKTK